MSEYTEMLPQKMSRREFLKRMGAAFVGKKLGWDKERLSEHDLTIAAMRLNGPYLDDVARCDTMIKKIETVLRREKPNVVITSEYTFDNYNNRAGNTSDNINVRLRYPLIIDRKGDNFFQIHQASYPKYKETIQRARALAAMHNAHLLLATFPELPLHGVPKIPGYGNSEYNTMLHIDPAGEIVGLKRKYNKPEGDWTITDNTGNQRKVLPMICQDVWMNYRFDPLTQQTTLFPPDWATTGAPYDIFVHSAAQGDLRYNTYNELMRKLKRTPEEEKDFSLLQGFFKIYYDNYWPLFGKNAPLIVSDLFHSGIFYQHKPPQYNETNDYAIAGVDFD